MPRTGSYEVNLNEEAPNDCEVCCCCLCQVWLYLFCCKKMTRSLRVKLLWIYTMIIGLTMGIVTGVVIFGPVQTEFTPTDTRIVSQKLSSTFCDSVDIESQTDDLGATGHFSAYLMDHEPSIDQDRHESFNTTAVDYVESGDYNYQVFYLLRGSKVTSHSIVDSYFDLLVFKGEINFRKFVENNLVCDTLDTYGCVFNEVAVFAHSNRNTFSWNIEETDDYYFVYMNRIQGSWIKTTYHLMRTIYDTRESVSLSSCSKTSSCVYDLNFNTQIYLVIHMDRPDRDNVYPDSRDVIETSCIARSWLYVVIFFGGSSVWCLLVSFCIFKWCSDPTTRARQRIEEGPNERSPLLWNWESSGPTVMVQPPKYEDVVRSTEPDLPSYEEATTSNSINNNRK